MVAHRCQSETIKITKMNKKYVKNENKKTEKIKKVLFRKKPTKLSRPMSAKSDKSFFYSKRTKYVKNQNKKTEKIKKVLFRKNPTKLSRPMSAKSDKKFFYSKRKKKLPWPMSAKSDT